MKLSKQHYEAVAQILRNQMLEFADETWALIALTGTAEELAMYFEENNENFRRDLFMEACGIGELNG